MLKAIAALLNGASGECSTVLLIVASETVPVKLQWGDNSHHSSVYAGPAQIIAMC